MASSQAPVGTLGDLDPSTSPDTFKILIATDNHIGYMERDPIRGQDSINTFREILQLAVKHDVDFILLGGDLFHENRPSRDCLYQVMAALREYCLGDKPIEIELLSDPDQGKAAGYSFPAVNYEDPNLNVSYPVFSIHGNHDDPQGAGPEGALCALDMLSVSGLINYMGKIDLPLTDAEVQSGEGGISIKPVLLRKGTSKLGIYGVGNVKDARMHFELRSNRVKMFMPKDKDRWFNIMVIHQNRVPHGPQQSVPEGMFDDSIDLVLWGHEHDCRVTPEEVAGKRYKITQPGSSVATSLAEGESLEKHVALLHVQGKKSNLTPLPLRTVRPFVMGDCSLTDAAEDEGLDLSDRMEITKFLRRKVNKLIEKATEDWDERNRRFVELGEPALPRMLPLIRLKVDTTGVSEMSNPVRFGQEFQGQIANPRDVLVFHRAKKTAMRGDRVIVEQPELSIDDPDLTIAEKLSKVRVQTLVKEYLSAQELQLLGEAGMSDAIETFVDKDDIHAIHTHVSGALRGLMKGIQANGNEIEEDNLDDIMEQVRERQEKEYLERRGTDASAQKKGKGKGKADSDAESEDSMMMEVDHAGDGGDEDFEDESGEDLRPMTKGKKVVAPAKKAPARGKKKPVSSEEDEEDEPAPKKRTGRAAAARSAPKTVKKAPAKKATASSAKQSTINFGPSQRATGTRAAAARSKKKTAEVVELDSDD